MRLTGKNAMRLLDDPIVRRLLLKASQKRDGKARTNRKVRGAVHCDLS